MLEIPALAFVLIDLSIGEKWIASYFGNRFIVSGLFQAQTSDISWFQLLKCEDLLLFFLIHDSK